MGTAPTANLPLLQRPALRSLLLFLDFFLIILAYYQVKPASRSLFLEYAKADDLPYLWTASAVLLLLLMPLYERLLKRYSRLHIVIATCALVIVLLLVFRGLLADPGIGVAVGFYLLVDIFSVVLVEQFWSLTNSVYRSSDGRRWYGLIASGGLVGGLVGGLLAGWLVSQTQLASADLLVVSAGIIALMMVLTLVLASRGFYEESTSSREMPQAATADVWTALRSSRYLALIALMLLMAQICEPIVEYQFMQLVEATYTDRDARTAYLSGFLSLISGLALVMNLALTPLLLRRFGTGAGILAQPLMLGLSSIGLAFDYRLWMAGAVKLCDRSLSYSINRTARELLYVWVDAATIYRAKAWIDMVGYRGFKIAGSVIILLLTQWLPWTVSAGQLSWVVVVMCTIWFASGLYIVRRLLPELMVRAQRPEPEAVSPETIPAPRNRTVLVAEDHEQVALLLRMALERWGFKVSVLADGQLVQQRVSEQSAPALVLLDIMLPNVSGLELVEHMRAQPGWQEVPILMLTGKTGEREINQALQAGANDYMIKPFDLKELRARIGRLLPLPDGGDSAAAVAPREPLTA